MAKDITERIGEVAIYTGDVKPYKRMPVKKLTQRENAYRYFSESMGEYLNFSGRLEAVLQDDEYRAYAVIRTSAQQTEKVPASIYVRSVRGKIPVGQDLGARLHHTEILK